MERKTCIAVLIILALSVSACGKKGELEPPDKGDEEALLLTVKG